MTDSVNLPFYATTASAKDVTCELERTGISLPAELTLNRFTPMDWRKVRCYIGWQY